MSKSLNTGLVIAFVGVDGSGKSSVVNGVAKSKLLNSLSGIKIAYLGNKSSWTPVRSHDNQNQKATLKTKILLAFTVVHAKIRIIPVFIARLRGKIILCDRYYYDQNIIDPTKKYIKNSLLKKVVNPFIQWMPMIPDITFYLKVDPDVAYARKKDYGIDKVRKVCKLYDDYLLPRSEVVAIDANQALDKVISDVLLKINTRVEKR